MNFYDLHKIQKSKQIQTGIQNLCEPYIKLLRPTDLELRPIVAGPSDPKERFSNFLDIILKPLYKLMPSLSYIRDDIDFFNYIQNTPNTVKDNTHLVSFYVTSLYTNLTIWALRPLTTG